MNSFPNDIHMISVYRSRELCGVVFLAYHFFLYWPKRAFKRILRKFLDFTFCMKNKRNVYFNSSEKNILLLQSVLQYAHDIKMTSTYSIECLTKNGTGKGSYTQHMYS